MKQTDLGDSAMRERQKAEQVYAETAFDFERDPLGSRDWELFWRGWRAAQLTPEQIEEMARRISDEIVKGMYRPESVKRVLREYLGGQTK